MSRKPSLHSVVSSPQANSQGRSSSLQGQGATHYVQRPQDVNLGVEGTAIAAKADNQQALVGQPESSSQSYYRTAAGNPKATLPSQMPSITAESQRAEARSQKHMSKVLSSASLSRVSSGKHG